MAEEEEYYIIKVRKLKCPIHFCYKDMINSSKQIEEKDALFKPCAGHYHTIKANKTIIICSNPKCVRRQKKYLKTLEAEEFFLYCNSPYCQ